MLHLIQSNKMECLADSLISVLQETAQQGSAAFESDVILVQSPGMSQWLKIRIAEKLGIAANIDFPLPSSFIWQLYRDNIADLPEQSAFTKPNMAWKLMSILPGLLDGAEFESIKKYLEGAPSLKLYQLANKIADVYDQYLVYRPDWILKWEKGDNELSEIDNRLDRESHLWQPVLWRALVRYSEVLGESPFHRANLHHRLITSLTRQQNQEPECLTNEKPLLVFGISAMPLQQLEVLSALAEKRDVVIFWFNPSQHYWGDIVDRKTQAKAQIKESEKSHLAGANLLDIGNPLLASWGKLGRDYQDMLLSFEYQQQDCFIDVEPKSLLEHIQSDINQLQFRATQDPIDAQELLSNGIKYPKVEILATDKSLHVHACHSKVRELEVLHDQLLGCFKHNPDWQPGDVIVMMPDVATYAPFIEGVFGAASEGLFIPYAISDRNMGQVSPIVSSFMQLMKLHQSRLTLSEVISLLDVPSTQTKFDINAQEYELIQHWLIDAGIRWGWDEKDKLRWDLPEEKHNTWVFGLQRLLAGYAMGSGQQEGRALYEGRTQPIAPYTDIEGQQAIALGKCYEFTTLLLKVLDFCQRTQTIEEKVKHALEFLTLFYQESESEQADLLSLRETLEKLLSHQHQYTHEIDQDVFVSELQKNIQDKGVGQRFLAGYVNFCTLMPMRSIPFKMVCLLGMNDADYPRQTVPISFDLMRLSPAKRGDRSRRLDDRYLFLEALLSAREQLYFSYIGFSQKDNSPRSPSILLSELLEYCQQGFCLSGELEIPIEQTEKNVLTHLSTEHYLQPFDQRYFIKNSDNGLWSFNSHYKSIAEQVTHPKEKNEFCGPGLPVLTEPQQQIDLDSFILFFQNPAKMFFTNRWQTRFFPLGEQLVNEEPFSFDGLDKYQLNERLTQHFIDENLKAEDLTEPHGCHGNISSIVAALRSEGRLPVGVAGDLAMAPISKQSIKLAEQVNGLRRAEEQTSEWNHTFELELDGRCLVGRIDHLYGRNLVLWRPGKLRAKDRVSLYLQWLCLCAAPPQKVMEQAYFVSTEKLYRLPAIESIEATRRLKLWIESWCSGQNSILHFYPEAAWKWVNSQDETQTLAIFRGNDFAAGEGQESHVNRVCPDLSEYFEVFSQLSESLLLPLVELEEQE